MNTSPLKVPAISARTPRAASRPETSALTSTALPFLLEVNVPNVSGKHYGSLTLRATPDSRPKARFYQTTDAQFLQGPGTQIHEMRDSAYPVKGLG